MEIAHRATRGTRSARALDARQEEAEERGIGRGRSCSRTFAIDALACPVCRGRMRLIAVVKNQASIARYLAAVGEPTEPPTRSPDRGPPYWKSTILRRRALGYEDA